MYLSMFSGEAMAYAGKDNDRTISDVENIAEIVARNDIPMEKLVEKLCIACNTVRSQGIICQLHKENLPSLKECTVCKHTVC